ncbi:hypothetical protein HanIR_Chr04g0163671 [Helianthus annuus]|nr:hypothetical protein HanIR_Chr04g0163671 [Helianthus annuus]
MVLTTNSSPNFKRKASTIWVLPSANQRNPLSFGISFLNRIRKRDEIEDRIRRSDYVLKSAPTTERLRS